MHVLSIPWLILLSQDLLPRSPNRDGAQVHQGWRMGTRTSRSLVDPVIELVDPETQHSHARTTMLLARLQDARQYLAQPRRTLPQLQPPILFKTPHAGGS